MNEQDEIVDRMCSMSLAVDLFMREVVLRFAVQDSEPQAWAKHFFENLDARLDNRETTNVAGTESVADRKLVWIELARQRFASVENGIQLHLAALAQDRRRS